MTTQDANCSGAPSPVDTTEIGHAPAPHGSVLDGAEFISDLLLEMSRASRRIYVKAFFYRKGALVDKVTEMLALRAQGGIATRLNADYYAK